MIDLQFPRPAPPSIAHQSTGLHSTIFFIYGFASKTLGAQRRCSASSFITASDDDYDDGSAAASRTVCLTIFRIPGLNIVLNTTRSP